jgi:hypothetical protein
VDPNAIFAVVGVFLLTRMERPGDRDLIAHDYRLVRRCLDRPAGKLPAAAAQVALAQPGWRMFVSASGGPLRTEKLPVLVRAAAHRLRAHDARLQFFDLLSDIVKNHIAMFARLHVPVLPDAAAYFRARRP